MYFCASLLQVCSCLVTSNDDDDNDAVAAAAAAPAADADDDDDDDDYYEDPCVYPDHYGDPYAWFRYLWSWT